MEHYGAVAIQGKKIIQKDLITFLDVYRKFKIVCFQILAKKK